MGSRKRKELFCFASWGDTKMNIIEALIFGMAAVIVLLIWIL